jgi:hypothetical protein
MQVVYFLIFNLSFLHLLTCIYIVWATSPLFLLPTPHRICSALKTRDNKKDISFLLVWDKDSYTERFLALFSCTCVLQSTLVHFYQISSLLLVPLPIVASVNFLYSVLNRERINHSQALCFLSLFLLCAFSPECVTHVQKYFCVCFGFIIHILGGENAIFGLLSLANFA